MKQFDIKKISKNIYKIEEPWFKEHANLYLFKGDKFNLLIDAGLGFFNIKKFLEKKGFKNNKIALTHSHFDHAQGIKHFLSEEILVNRKMHSSLKNIKMWGLKYFKKSDLKPKTPTPLNFEKTGEHFLLYLDKIKPQKLEMIDTGFFSFKPINLPGHTDDSVGYYDKKHKILVTGDALYCGKIYADFPNANKKKFKKSLKVISKIKFNLLLPGHNDVLDKKMSSGVIYKWGSILDS